MLVLGIETSCDETSLAAVKDGTLVRSCVISSSKNDFQKLGGVIPEDAARKQLESILPIVTLTLKEASVTPVDIDAIAVTVSPGLLGSLLVGTTTARALSMAWNKPIIPVHHTLGHLSSTWLTEKEPLKPQFPILTLSVSGGHTDLWYRTSHIKGELVSSTRDDAAGEAFDKGAVQLGLPYPGGPALATLADKGDEKKHPFPLPLQREKTLDFSFSGLKTSLKYLLKELGENAKEDLASIAASYQYAICRHLVDRLEIAIERFEDIKEVHIVGGVSANTRLRAMVSDFGQKHSVTVRWPSSLRYCTDNGAMIAGAGFFLAQEKPQMIGSAFTTSATSDLQSVVEKA